MSNKETIKVNSFLRDKFNDLAIEAFNEGLRDFEFKYCDIGDMFVTYEGTKVFDIYMTKYGILMVNCKVRNYDIPNMRQCNLLIQDFVFMTNAKLYYSKLVYD